MTAAGESRDRVEEFTVGDAPRLEVILPAGDLRLIPGEPESIVVRVVSRHSDRLTITQRGDTVVVSAEGARRSFRGSFDVTATVPPGTEADVRLASADLGVHVDLRALRASIASGDVRARDVSGDVAVKTASGNVRLGMVGGRLEATTASGDVSADGCDDLHATAASGDIAVRRVGGWARVRTAAGDISVRRFDGPQFEAKSLSGDVRLGIPPGKEVDVDVHTMGGSVRNQFPVNPDVPPTGDRCTVRIKSLSGDVVFAPAD